MTRSIIRSIIWILFRGPCSSLVTSSSYPPTIQSTRVKINKILLKNDPVWSLVCEEVQSLSKHSSERKKMIKRVVELRFVFSRFIIIIIIMRTCRRRSGDGNRSSDQWSETKTRRARLCWSCRPSFSSFFPMHRTALEQTPSNLSYLSPKRNK